MTEHGNPHVLWRQVLGFVFWTSLISFPAGGPVGAIFALTLGGVTFADAWLSGIYKNLQQRSFLNISPMGWGLVMALLFIVAYPVYLLNRNRLKTTQATNAYFIATILLGGIVTTLFVLNFVITPRGSVASIA